MATLIATATEDIKKGDRVAVLINGPTTCRKATAEDTPRSTRLEERRQKRDGGRNGRQ